MPAIMKKNVAAGTVNAVEGERFQRIPQGGAYITLYASTALAGGNIDLSVENEDHLVAAEVNIESGADIVDTDRDLVLDREPVAAGQLYLGVNSQICNFLLIIE